MISFSKLGQRGQLGNQMFQYAFLRSQAERLGTQYACPNWFGDKIFDLSETDRVVLNTPTSKHTFFEPKRFCGFSQEALDISDNTEINGYFQTAKYFSKNARSWFAFKNPPEQLPDLTDVTGMHLRFGDYENLSHVYSKLSISYYKESLNLIELKNVAVFSDEIDKG